MPKLLPVITFPLVLVVGLALLACGGKNRSLPSVISPASAASPAQFSATALYNQSPSTVNVTSTITWCVGTPDGVCAGNIAIGANINAGYAQCDDGFPGSVTILAGQPEKPLGPDGGLPLKPFASAQLTCP